MKFSAEDRRRIKLNALSGIDDDIIQSCSEERYRLLARRNSQNKRRGHGMLIRVTSIAASAAILIVGVIAALLMIFSKTAPIYTGMSVTSTPPSYAHEQMELPSTLPSLDLTRSAMARSSVLRALVTPRISALSAMSSPSESASDTPNATQSAPGDLSPSVADVFYTNPNEDFYITIHFENPDAFEILSFTLNETKYTSYMFEQGSDLEHIILKCNLGDVPPGVYEYTIDAIKYVDGTEIKDVVIEGDRTVKISARQTNAPTVENIAVTQSLGSVSVTGELRDSLNTISSTNGYIELQLLHGNEIVETKRFDTSEPIQAQFSTFPSFGYTVRTVLFYNGFDENGFTGHIDRAEAIVAIAPFTLTVESCGINSAVILLDWNDSVPLDERAIDVRIDGKTVYSNRNASRIILSKLKIGSINSYSVHYKYNGVDCVSEYEVQTGKYATPVVSASVENVTLTGYTLRVDVYDPAGAIRNGLEIFGPGINSIEVKESFTQEITGLEPLTNGLVIIDMYYFLEGGESDWQHIEIPVRTQTPGLAMSDGTIIGIGECTDTELYINYPVASNAFSEDPNITAVHFGSGARTVGSSAFQGCSSLSEIDLGGASSIESLAFAACKGSETLVIPEEVDELSATAFSGTPFDLVILNGAFRIREVTPGLTWSTYFNRAGFVIAAYKTLSNFDTDLQVPRVPGCISVETLENGLIIATCENGDRAVAGLKNISGSSDMGGVTTVVPDGVIAIADYAEYIDFKGANIGTLVLPESLKRIGERAFSEMTFDVISIPAGVEYIGANAFDSQGEPRHSKESEPGSIYVYRASTSGWATNWIQGLSSTYSSTARNIYLGVSHIEKDENGSEYVILNDGTKILTLYAGPVPVVEIPEGVNEIAPFAFDAMKDKITSVKMPSTLKAVRALAFNGCSRITSFDFPESVVYIGSKAITSSVSEVYIPRSVEIIDASAIKAKNIYCAVEKAPVGWNTGWYTGSPNIRWSYNSTPDITDENGYVYHYEGTDTVLTDYVGKSTDLIIPEGITVIADNAMQNVRYVSSISFPGTLRRIGINFLCNLIDAPNLVFIPSNVVEIGSASSSYSHSLTSIKYLLFESPEHSYKAWGSKPELIFNAQPPFNDGKGGEYFVWDDALCLSRFTSPFAGLAEEYHVLDGTSRILDGVFQGNSMIKKVYLPDNDISIGASAFAHCPLLEEVVGGRIVSVGNAAFANCPKLTHVVATEHTKSIGSNSFSNCTSIQSVYLSAVESIGSNCFTNCTSISSVYISGAITLIPDYCFDGCTALERVIFPHTVTDIGAHAFSNCKALTEVPIPDALGYVGDYAFYGCSGIKSVTFPTCFSIIGKYAFADSGVSEVTLNEGLTVIGSNAFSNTGVVQLIIPKTVNEIGERIVDDDCMLFFKGLRPPINFELESYYSYSNSIRGTIPILSFKGFETVDGVLYAIGRTTNEQVTEEVRIVLKLPNASVHVTLAEGTAYIFQNAAGTEKLQSLILPDTMKEICAYARIKAMFTLIPESVTTIGEFAFETPGSGLLVFKADELPAKYTETDGLPSIRNCVLSFKRFETGELGETYAIGRLFNEPLDTERRFLLPNR